MVVLSMHLLPKMVTYCTGRYCWNIPLWYLNQYRNKAESYCSKYRDVPACFSCSDGFWSFSAVFAFPAGRNLNGFFWKNFKRTPTSGHHWSISLPDHQQNHLLLPFSHLDLLLSHCHLPSSAPLVFFLNTVHILWMFYIFHWCCTCTRQAVVPLISFSLDFSAKRLKGFYFICFFESHVTRWSISLLFHAYYALFFFFFWLNTYFALSNFQLLLFFGQLLRWANVNS